MSKYIKGTMRVLAGLTIVGLAAFLIAARILFGLAIYIVAIGGAYLIYMELF